MAVSKTVNGANTTVTFSYTALTAKVESTLTDAAKNLFGSVDHGVVLGEGETVDNLTPAEIGAVLDAFVKKAIVQAAKAYNIEQARLTSAQATITENETKYL